MHPIIVIVLGIFFGGISAYLAHKKGRDPLGWFIGGALFGIFGVLILLLLPPKSKPQPGGINKNFFYKNQQAAPEPLISDRKTAYRDQLMQKNWYYLDTAHKKNGPMNYVQLKSSWHNGQIVEKTYIWTEGMNDWQKIEDIPELYGDLSLADA